MLNRKATYLYIGMLLVWSLLMGLCIVKHTKITQRMQNEINKQKTINEELEINNQELESKYANLEQKYLTLQDENEDLSQDLSECKAENLEFQQAISEYEKKEEEELLLSKTTKKAETNTTQTKQVLRENTKSERTGLSESEIYLLAQLIYLEGGNTSYNCQLAIGSVVLNLMKADGVSLKTEIYTAGRFSVASSVAYTKPSDTSLRAARYLAEHGSTLPSNVKCFRNNHYFDWCTPYTSIDNVYFGSY